MLTPEEALRHWSHDGSIRPAPDAGLINGTWLVGEPARWVLQWVHPIFDPRIHLDIAAITRRLRATGIGTLQLQPTRDGDLWVTDERGCWRLTGYLPGATFHRLSGPSQGAAAGRLVGRFHAALADWQPQLQAPRRDVHNTPARMAELSQALEAADGHSLVVPARQLGGQILDRWASWDGELDLPPRFCHGDLKVSNLRFDATGERAVALIDLDTLGPMPLACELGDAWRSWCNPAPEDEPDSARFDAEIFAASARAWLAEGPPLSPAERDSLVPGIERICLELASRFCADAVVNTYFREDRERYPEPGQHNLSKARGQLRLAAAARDARGDCQAVIRAATP